MSAPSWTSTGNDGRQPPDATNSNLNMLHDRLVSVSRGHCAVACFDSRNCYSLEMRSRLNLYCVVGVLSRLYRQHAVPGQIVEPEWEPKSRCFYCDVVVCGRSHAWEHNVSVTILSPAAPAECAKGDTGTSDYHRHAIRVTGNTSLSQSSPKRSLQATHATMQQRRRIIVPGRSSTSG